MSFCPPSRANHLWRRTNRPKPDELLKHSGTLKPTERRALFTEPPVRAAWSSERLVFTVQKHWESPQHLQGGGWPGSRWWQAALRCSACPCWTCCRSSLMVVSRHEGGAWCCCCPLTPSSFLINHSKCLLYETSLVLVTCVWENVRRMTGHQNLQRMHYCIFFPRIALENYRWGDYY